MRKNSKLSLRSLIWQSTKHLVWKHSNPAVLAADGCPGLRLPIRILVAELLMTLRLWLKSIIKPGSYTIEQFQVH